MTHENFALIPEMDAAILERLPKEGAKMGQIRPLAKQVKALANELRDEGLTGAAISGRMGILRRRGFVVPVVVQPVGNGKGYQITPSGEAFVEAVKNGTYDQEES